MMSRILTSAAALALTTGIASAEYTLHIIHINDLHSRIESINRFDSTCNADGEAEGKCFGGVARVATKINELRDQITAEGGNVIVLDAGDQFQGSLMYTTYKGTVEAEFMEAIGFDVMAVGNHEFDDGPIKLSEFADLVSFPIISGNLDLTSEDLLKDKIGNHVVLEVGGEKIGIVSALATDTVETSSPGPNVVFQNEIEALSQDVAELEAEGVTKIIALTHVGLSKDLAIAEAVEGLDAVVGGHSHTLLSNTAERAAGPYPTLVGDTPVVQAYAYSKYVGHLVLTFDDAGMVTSAEGDTIVLDASVTPDEAIIARVAELAGPIEELKARPVSDSAAFIDGARENCRYRECAMGNLVADAILDRVRDQGIQIALQNGGGLRASIGEGQITMGDVLTVLPFQNTLSTFRVSGSVLKEALENAVAQFDDPAKDGRFAQVSGLRYTITPAAESGGRISDIMVEENGSLMPLDLDKVYGVVSNNYVRNGGDGYSMFAGDDKDAYDFGPDLADVVAAYLSEAGSYTPFLDGRITFVE